MRYHNWNEFVSTYVEGIAEPEDVEGVQAVVREARRRKRHVKAIGAGHSFNDIGMCEDILVDVSRLDAKEVIDRDGRLVRVGAGVPLNELVTWLEGENLALPNIGAWMEQTVAGVISTATHGTSGRWRKTLMGAVEKIHLVDGLAQRRTLQGEELEYLTLGFFGIITEVELRCEPLFWLRQRNKVLPGETVLRNLERYLRKHDFVDVRWVGNSEKVILRYWDKVERPPNLADRTLRRLEGMKLKGLNSMLTALRVPAWDEDRAQRLFETLGHLYVATGGWFDNTSIWYESLTFNSLGVAAPHQERELALPREQATECLLALRKAMLAEPRSASLEIQVRFTPGSHILMAPTYERETMWFNLNMLAPGHTERLVEDLTELAAEFGARPHWAKAIPARNPWMKELYARDAKVWEKKRKCYDPDGHFLNDWYHRHIGLTCRSLLESKEPDDDAHPEP